MKYMTELSTHGGQSNIFINPAHIIYVVPGQNGGSTVMLTNGESIDVTEVPEEVCAVATEMDPINPEGDVIQ